ncbi:MAG: ABC transporter permease [Cyanobacteria bacterium P01_D01_bin.105]
MKKRAYPISHRDLQHLCDLLYQLTIRELKLRYNRSVLGIVWTLIKPLFQLLTFSFIFRAILNIDFPHYASSVFLGLLVWTWFQSSLTDSANVINANASLIRQPGFPSPILPIVVSMVDTVHFVLALPILFIFLLVDGVSLQPIILATPILMLLQSSLTVSISYLLAALNVTFYDTKYTTGVVLQMMFYATPVFYEANSIPPDYQFWYWLNPMAHLVSAFRALLIQGVAPNWGALGLIAVGVFTLLCLGHRFFRAQSIRFAEEI